MTARKPVLRTAVAIALVLGLLTVPAIPAAADEVGGGWTQGITEWVKDWITGWQSPAEANPEGDRNDLGSSRQGLKPTSNLDEDDKDIDFDFDFDLPEIVRSIHEAQSCDSHPHTDPNGQC